MKYAHLIPLVALVLAAANSHAQARIYRCGNSYTNDAVEAKSKNCKLVEGGYITVVEGTKVQGAAANNSTKVASSQKTTPSVSPGSVGNCQVQTTRRKAASSGVTKSDRDSDHFLER